MYASTSENQFVVKTPSPATKIRANGPGGGGKEVKRVLSVRAYLSGAVHALKP